MHEETTPFYDLLQRAFLGTHDQKRPEETFTPYLSTQVRLVRLGKGSQFINSGLTLNKIYLLLSGKCYIVKYSVDGKSIIADTMFPVQLFGLYEMLDRTGMYRATVTAASECCLLEISSAYFRSCLEQDIKTCLLTLEYLAGVMEQSISKSDRTLFNSALQNLVLYIHQQCRGASLPHALPISRKTMSEELNINLRTLYRYLDKLKEENLILVQRGKIVVGPDQFARLDQFVGELSS